MGRNDGGDDPAFTAGEIAEMERLAVEHWERTRRLGGRWGLVSMCLEHVAYTWRCDLARWWHRRRGRLPWLLLRKWWWRCLWRRATG